MPGLDAQRRGTGVTPLANFRVDRSLPVPGGARPEGRDRPGQARPHLPSSTLRPQQTKLCGLSVPEPARGSVPVALRGAGRRLCTARGAQWTPAEAQQPATRGAASLAPPLPVTARPRPPALSPFPGCFCHQALDSPLPAACVIFQHVSCQRTSVLPAVTVKCLWTLKFLVLFLDLTPEIR